MIRTSIAFTALALCCAPVAAQDGAATSVSPTQAWKFKVGDSNDYEQTAEVKVEQSSNGRSMGATTMSITARYTQTVKSVDAKGTATLGLKYDSVKLKVENAMGTILDFDSSRPEDMQRAQQNPGLQKLAGMVGMTQEIKVSRGGKVLSATGGPKGSLFSSPGDWQAAFLQFAEKPVPVGGTWKSSRVSNKSMKMVFSNHHTLVSADKGKVTVKTQSTATVDASSNPALAHATLNVTKSKGETTQIVDVANARLDSLTSRFDLALEIGQVGGTMTLVQKMTTTSQIQRLGPAKPKTPPAKPRPKKTKTRTREF